MNKKVLGITIVFLIAAILATPLVSAVPGAEKKNGKFEFFELFCSGAQDTNTGTGWPTFLQNNSSLVKTRHLRDRGWITGDTVNLTVGEKTFNMTSEPYSISYTTTFDLNLVINNDGSVKHQVISLTDVVTLYHNGEPIGTLVIKINPALIVLPAPPRVVGRVVGCGTGALEGVHVSAMDPGGLGGGLFKRTGTIRGWPEEITNI
jgi:hypothetical protein